MKKYVLCLHYCDGANWKYDFNALISESMLEAIKQNNTPLNLGIEEGSTEVTYDELGIGREKFHEVHNYEFDEEFDHNIFTIMEILTEEEFAKRNELIHFDVSELTSLQV